MGKFRIVEGARARPGSLRAERSAFPRRSKRADLGTRKQSEFLPARPELERRPVEESDYFSLLSPELGQSSVSQLPPESARQVWKPGPLAMADSQCWNSVLWRLQAQEAAQVETQGKASHLY